MGLAISDPTGTLASPLGTLTRRAGRRAPIGAIAEAADSHDVEKIVFGLPLTPAGEEDEWCAEVRTAGEAVARRTGLPVVYVDERFTSARAERAIRGSGLRKRQREEKGRVDSGAAAIILQAYLDGTPPR